MPQYAELILPVPLVRTFSYRLPDGMTERAMVGMRVMVPFGKSHQYMGIILSITPHQPEGVEVKDVLELLDDQPIVRHPQVPLWQWISQYYLCPIGDVMKAALPSQLKPEEGKEGTVREDFKAKMRTFVNIHPGLSLRDTDEDKGQLEKAFDSLKRSPQQTALFMKLLDMSHALQKESPDPVPQDELLKAAGTTTQILNELKKKGLLTTFEQPVSRLDTGDAAHLKLQTEAAFPLTEMQKVAYRNICLQLKDHPVCLLHGVTSSGKTEIYIHLMQEVIGQGRQVLMMVPEIALTTQLCMRLRRVFGRQLMVYHSKLSDTERVEIWKAMLAFSNKPDEAGPRIILGVRSSVFLPFAQLGLVIVDEEHEPSYKQQDPAPRYNGRDVAIVLAQKHGAKVVLGSATPSLESYYLAHQGRYGLVELTERHAGVSMPRISLISLREARKDQTMQGPFSPTLLNAVGRSLNNGQQAILFQNRRGFSAQIECAACGWVPRCPRCDVSLSYHKHSRMLQCHYCGYQQQWPSECPQCHQHKFTEVGFGTERIEETLSRLLPIAKTSRMDTDTTTSRRSYERIIQDFEQKKYNVLIGTQMVSKGLDFSGVETVGILSADAMMNQPDFRAHERAFQLMEQVAGRAGRRAGQEGEVLIQCSDPRMPLLNQVRHHDYKAMAETQLADRQKYGYPPFTRLIMIYLKGRYEDRTRRLAEGYAAVLRQTFGQRVLGPEAPPVSRVKNFYIQQILLKVERQANTSQVRQLLMQIEEYERQNVQEYKQIMFYYDVDPM